MTLTLAIGVSLLVSLTVTPMMCALFLKPGRDKRQGWISRFGERAFDGLQGFYARTLTWVLRHQLVILLVTLGPIALNVYLFTVVPTGFFPQQDTGRIVGNIQGEQDISFLAMRAKMAEMAAVVQTDPAVETVVAFTGGSGNTTNSGRVFISLK